MVTIKSTRLHAGGYDVTSPQRPGLVVEVYTVPGNPAYGEPASMVNWIARAAWRLDTYTDPLPTKRMAMAAARDMLEGE